MARDSLDACFSEQRKRISLALTRQQVRYHQRLQELTSAPAMETRGTPQPWRKDAVDHQRQWRDV